MRIGAFIFLVGLMANVVNIPRNINAHQYSGNQADNEVNFQHQRLSFYLDPNSAIFGEYLGKFSPPNIGAYFSQNVGQILLIAEENAPTDQSDSSDDQRGSGRIDASIS